MIYPFNRISPRLTTGIIAFVILSGCAVIAKIQLDDLYGKPAVVDRYVDQDYQGIDYQHIKPIIDRRCVVCHGCYDAPCQLKMSSMDAIDRGANTQKVL